MSKQESDFIEEINEDEAKQIEKKRRGRKPKDETLGYKNVKKVTKTENSTILDF